MNARHHTRRLPAALALAVLACVAVAAQRGPVETGAGSTAAARRFLEGRWGLVSFEVARAGAPPLLLKGQGSLVYDGFGNLEVEIRVDPATAALLAEAGIQSSNGLVSTRGRTILDVQHHTLTYVLQGQPSARAAAGPLALSRPRHWEVVGSDLVLTTKDDQGRPLSVARWRKSG
jgi:hypothetical protein